MIKSITQYACLAWLGCVVMSACSRPVAYFQPDKKEVYKTTVYQEQPVDLPDGRLLDDKNHSQVDIYSSEAPVYASVAKQPTKAMSAPLTSRTNRITHTVQHNQTGQASSVLHKVTGFKRAIVKTLNKRIAHRLAPQREKAISNRGYLIGGAVLLIGGVVLLIAGTGTGAFIGLVVGLVGALGVILGLVGL